MQRKRPRGGLRIPAEAIQTTHWQNSGEEVREPENVSSKILIFTQLLLRSDREYPKQTLYHQTQNVSSIRELRPFSILTRGIWGHQATRHSLISCDLVKM